MARHWQRGQAPIGDSENILHLPTNFSIVFTRTSIGKLIMAIDHWTWTGPDYSDLDRYTDCPMATYHVTLTSILTWIWILTSTVDAILIVTVVGTLTLICIGIENYHDAIQSLPFRSFCFLRTEPSAPCLQTAFHWFHLRRLQHRESCKTGQTRNHEFHQCESLWVYRYRQFCHTSQTVRPNHQPPFCRICCPLSELPGHQYLVVATFCLL